MQNPIIKTLFQPIGIDEYRKQSDQELADHLENYEILHIAIVTSERTFRVVTLRLKQ